ncbi:MAG TPA: iron-containing redox enzyme family protein [Gaiellales bacterium]|nr:iron-containing redox enzyme family protein [Gaiellales bacterium]
MQLPRPRGPVSAALIDRLAAAPGGSVTVPTDGFAPADPLTDDDLQLSLWVLYELHYRGFDAVSADWEWDPALLTARRELEARFEAGLRALLAAETPGDADVAPADVPAALDAVMRADDGPSLSSFMQRQATLEQFREVVVHRSIYHLKEADPHAWAIPRLAGAAKAALVEIEADEYGGGQPARMHSELFRRLLRGLGLDDGYGHYVDAVPAVTLLLSNTMSFFGLHRRWRGATAGHLAAIEMSSSLPSRAYSNGLQRLGFDSATTLFYDEHIEADAVHEQIAAHDLCGSLAAAEPELTADVLFGARAAVATDRLFAEHVLGAWAGERSSLRSPLADAPEARPLSA